MNGKLIVFYGINNLGKSTQAKLLVETLNSRGIKAEYIKYPIYDLAPSGPMLNNYLRGGNPHQLTPREAQIIYALNRTQYEPLLKDKLKSGINIIAEDYTGTGIAWGMGAGVAKDFLLEANSHLLKEDLGLLFDGQRFETGIEKNHKHETNNDLTETVRQAHLELAKDFGWQLLDANKPIEDISKTLQELISKELNINL